MKLLCIIFFFFIFTGASFAQQTFADDFNGLTYIYPEGWFKDENSAGNYFVTNDTAYFIAQVNLFFKDFVFDAENIRDSAYRKDLHDKMNITTGRDVSILDYGNMTVSRLPAYFILWSVPGRNGSESSGSKIMQIQAGDDRKLYTFNAGAPNALYSSYRFIFESIIASIKISRQ